MVDVTDPNALGAEHVIHNFSVEADSLARRLVGLLAGHDPAIVVVAMRRAFVATMLKDAGTLMETCADGLAAIGEVCLELERQAPGAFGERLQAIGVLTHVADLDGTALTLDRAG